MEQKKIIKCIYTGEVDENGLPHGKGKMRYVVEPKADSTVKGLGDLRYSGEFCHGIRQGEGDLHGLGLINNPVSEYEWYAEGDYDSCGRFLGSVHSPGSWQRLIACWYPRFEGTWKDDMPLTSRWDNEITADDKATAQQTTREAVGSLPQEVEP